MIPKAVHVVWIGSNPNPHLDYLRSWQRHNPLWTVRYWTDDNLPPLRHQRIIDQLPYYSAKVNVIRLELLLRFGGLYSDADSECLKPLDGLVADHKALGMMGRRGGVQNATLACEPGHPVCARMVDDIPRHFRRLQRRSRRTRRGVDFRDVFGTRFITPYLRADPTFHQVDADKRKGTRRIICERSEQCAETVIVHDQDGSWRTQLGGRRVFL